jgi:hypothetical protein
MDTNNLFEDLKPDNTSRDWEASFFNRLENQKKQSRKKIGLKDMVYFSFLLLNLFVIVYSIKTKQTTIVEDKYRVLSETLFSSNNY